MIVKCRECGGQVSTNAASCPHCGNNMEKASSVVDTLNAWWQLFLYGLLGLFLVIALVVVVAAL